MPSKKVTMRASMSNQISHFGIMGGLYNRKISGRSSMNRVTSRLEIPAGAASGLRYMKLHNLLSRNPLGSGGVGRMFNIRSRGSGLGSRSTTSDKSVSNLGSSLGSDLGPCENCWCGDPAGGDGAADAAAKCWEQCSSTTSSCPDVGFGIKCYDLGNKNRCAIMEAWPKLKPSATCSLGGAGVMPTRWGFCESGFCPFPTGGAPIIYSYCPSAPSPQPTCISSCTITNKQISVGISGCMVDISSCCSMDSALTWDGSGCVDSTKVCAIGINTNLSGELCGVDISGCGGTPQPAAFGSYTVKSGDTCFKIADALCQDGNDYSTEICKSGTVCTNLQAGATIKYDCTKTQAHC